MTDRSPYDPPRPKAPQADPVTVGRTVECPAEGVFGRVVKLDGKFAIVRDHHGDHPCHLSRPVVVPTQAEIAAQCEGIKQAHYEARRD